MTVKWKQFRTVVVRDRWRVIDKDKHFPMVVHRDQAKETVSQNPLRRLADCRQPSAAVT
jgi:hypothetical protein